MAGERCIDAEHLRGAATKLLRVDGPYAYQLRVARRLLEGENVVLQAPTGAGKTKGALLPFLYARHAGMPFADRLIYAVPMRTLVTALADEAKALVAAVDPALRVTVQMGGQPEDPFLEGDIVFTTIDQLLSAYIGAPVSLPGRNANIVGGAALGSYLVFDEFHLLEPDRALSTAIDLAARLAAFSRVLLMSATVTAGVAELIGRRAGAVFEQVADDELEAMPSQRGKQRRIHYVPETLTAGRICNGHRQRSIAVVNTVDRAQQLYADLRDLQPELGNRLRLLHARFLAEDRAKTEAWARHVFREGSTDEGILIATQVIEVGLNISAQTLHTDLAPAAAIFQRAGRCARFAGDAGDVYVYALPQTEAGAPRITPYERGERGPILATGKAIEAWSGRTYSFADERAVTEQAYSAYDAQELGNTNPRQRRKDVAEAMRAGDLSAVRRLVRDAASVQVAIHRDPTTLSPRDRLTFFSIADGVWNSFARRTLEADQPVWLLRAPDELENGPAPPTWQRVTDPRELAAAFWVCVAPQSATYDEALGVRLGVASEWESPLVAAPERTQLTFNRLERYERHVALTVGQIDRQSPDHRIAAQRLAAALGIAAEALEVLVRLAAALHDVAKLAEGWQAAAWRWEQAVKLDVRRDGFLAHTDRDLSQFRQRELSHSGKYRLPGHAAEGAVAALPALRATIDQALADAGEGVADAVEQALVCAIARHHGGEMRALEDFALSGAARDTASRSLASLGFVAPGFQDHPNGLLRLDFPKWAINPAEDPLGFLLYWHISRRLRRADQLATEEGAA